MLKAERPATDVMAGFFMSGACPALERRNDDAGRGSARHAWGDALCAWFGKVPSFHGADLLEISLSSTGPSRLRIHGWVMTDQTDAGGFFILDRHAVVTITLVDLTHVTLSDFDLVGIIGGMKIGKVDDTYVFTWDASYGVEGMIRARQARIDLAPGPP